MNKDITYQIKLISKNVLIVMKNSRLRTGEITSQTMDVKIFLNISF